MVRKNLIYIFLFLTTYCYSQDSTIQAKSLPDSEIAKALQASSRKPDFNRHTNRKWIIGAGTTLAYSGSFIFLNQAWYKGYPRSSFHTFNDVGEWLQMDKIGHAWTAYNTGKAGAALWRWAGVDDQTSVLLGSGSGLLYMLSIEYLDGHSAEWGWSWGDAGADLFGSILFSSQQLGWNQQKIQLKFSSHKRNYDPSLEKRANDLFGSSLPQRLLKDYNAQTYWLSFNLNSFLKTNLPDWLNISVGYGADGMFGGYKNLSYDKTGNIVFDRRDIERYRQWYLSPDIDFTKIKTNSKIVRSILFALNALKMPAPALEFSKNKFKLHALSF